MKMSKRRSIITMNDFLHGQFPVDFLSSEPKHTMLPRVLQEQSEK